MKYACDMRKFLSFGLVLVFSFVAAAVPANSAVKLGDSCKSVGQTTSVNGPTLICTKSGSKLVWSKSSKADSYDAAFANAFLAEAKRNAAKILEEAKSTANQISSPPYCSTGNSSARASIGSDGNLRSLVFENPGICDITVRASASFRCDSPLPPSKNTVRSTGVFPLRAKEKLIFSNWSYYFPQVNLECRLLTGSSGLAINLSRDGQEPSVMTLTSNYSGNFNQYEASKKAEQLIKSAKARADEIIANAKNPVLIARAWKASAPLRVAAAKAASEQKVQDAGIGKKCVVGTSCLIGSTGPGGGVVFYDAGSKQWWGRYLEFAPAGWSGTPEDPQITWCEYPKNQTKIATLVSDATQSQTLGVEIGKGKGNTIVAAKFCDPSAALVAASYRGGGMSDWFLPSRDELNELCKYAHRQTTGSATVMCIADKPVADRDWRAASKLRPGFNRDYYWSSSEAENVDFGYIAGAAWAKTFDNDEPFRFDIPKNTRFVVRPIRAF